MDSIVTPIERYGKPWYKVVIGHSYRLLRIWRRQHITLVNPRGLPSGEPPTVTAVPYHRNMQGYDPEKRERLVNVEGYGIVTASEAERADPDLRVVLEDTFASLDAVPLRGEYIRFRNKRVVPLGVLLLNTDEDRQAYRLALQLGRQADALKEPTPLEELRRAAAYIVSEVNVGSL